MLSFQGPTGGLTFPLNGVSLHWFERLWKAAARQYRRAIPASLELGLVVMVLTVVFSLLGGPGVPQALVGSNTLFFVTMASLIVPSIVIARHRP